MAAEAEVLEVDTTTAVRRVKATLRGPVLDLLSDRVPELKVLQRERAYEKALDDVALLDRCMKAFRQDRERFRHVLLGPDRKPVDDDYTTLACGRTIAEVIAMTVRSAARRYFRRQLGHRRPPRPVAPPTGLVARLLAHLSPPPPPPRPKASPADELYAAIKDYLLHDWQVGMVPTYAEMKPAQVRDLGLRLLEIRDPDALRSAIGLPPAPKAEEKPAQPQPVARTKVDVRPEKPELQVPVRPVAKAAEPAVVLAQILSPDGTRLKAEAFSSVMLKPEVRKVLPNGGHSVHVTSLLRGVGGPAAAALTRDLGLGMDQMAVFLVSAQGALGNEVFSRMFGPDADPRLLLRLVDHAKAAGLAPDSSLADCAKFVAKVFARFTSGKAA